MSIQSQRVNSREDNRCRDRKALHSTECNSKMAAEIFLIQIVRKISYTTDIIAIRCQDKDPIRGLGKPLKGKTNLNIIFFIKGKNGVNPKVFFFLIKFMTKLETVSFKPGY